MSIAANKRIVLQGGARADNVMWAVAGASTFGAGSRFQGNILGATSAAFVTGSTINGRVLVQTAVTLQMTTVTSPSSPLTANDVATQLMDAASAKNEEAQLKMIEAAEKRAAADQKQQDAMAKRAVADSMKQDADARKARAQNTRDTMLGNITDVNKKKKAQHAARRRMPPLLTSTSLRSKPGSSPQARLLHVMRLFFGWASTPTPAYATSTSPSPAGAIFSQTPSTSWKFC